VYGCRHNGSSVSLWKDGSQVVNSVASFTLADRTLTGNYIGRSNWPETPRMYFQGSMRGLLVWDRALSDEAITGMSQWLRDTYT
jgi:hypothetical protein